MASVSEFRTGMTIKLDDGNLYAVTEFQHVKPGKGQAFIRTRIKSITSGKVLDKTFKLSENVDIVRTDAKKMQYLYSDGDMHHFMDNETYEQVGLSQDVVGDYSIYLVEGLVVDILFYEGKAISFNMPVSLELKILETEPGYKGNTVNNLTKQAKVGSGAVINVPLFINEGDIVKVDTRNGAYIERINK